MSTYRHWSVSLWRDPDDVPHCQILSPDKTEWQLISATLCGWRRCFVPDQLWLMTRIWEEEDCLATHLSAYDSFTTMALYKSICLLKNAPKCIISIQKPQNFSGEGAQPPSQDSIPRPYLPRRLWHLNSTPLAQPQRLGRLSSAPPKL